MNKDKVPVIHIFLLAVVAAVLIWSVIKPNSYATWALESVPALAGLILVAATYKRLRLTTLSYVIIALLAISIFIGGHYTYEKMPVFNWIKDDYDLKRNHYDRLGHFLKGLFVIVIREILLRKTALTKGGWLAVISMSMMLAIAALYEIIEWLVSKISHGGKAARDFLGTQGDIWDTQWDMSLTLVGTILALIFISRLHNRLLKKR
ncbi:DUF2238 domain-containing protein [Peribacillus cavernae]|uniref:DUF2238 domain-containing protein n=1 Tax=Peribacillus cavernae TaxID=1674310 RepID=A0A3S0VGE2_9BACI|nr:DUF2238 domain-containing protein [Peribacillus cavernae]MDQ0218625.1 putative membrane protein [Peribacillus cavernae]RUQ31608.1 DUF2238 domain-containing protein [Peribacillus cavernae]